MRAGGWERGGAPFLAITGLIGAIGLAGVTGWRAFNVDVLVMDHDAAAEVRVPKIPVRDPRVAEEVLVAVDKDPFHPERRRPTRRFRLPSERVQPGRRTAAPRVGLPGSMRLTGTMVYPEGGGAAMLSQPGRPTRMVRVGEQVGELTLVEVGREQAVFTAPSGSRFVVRVARPGA